ncbi:MAG TPA: SDR family oxidoreductase, partial [Actinomycetota bacterium]|nr:SDR family oxidoreductase [Actinomycetota bacterium]
TRAARSCCRAASGSGPTPSPPTSAARPGASPSTWPSRTSWPSGWPGSSGSALVLAAIERDENRVRTFDLEGATRLATLKLVGYAETIHQLAPRIDPEGSVVLFGGRAKDRPYPGSTMVSTVNGGVTGLVHSLAVELAPVRCNAIHPGIVGDSPYWSAKGEPALEPVRNRTPSGRLVTMEDIVGAVVFLLENRSVNGENLHVDGGWLLL